jgi:1-acyl-sn-glycerol-3-phosphate acyltransferase
LNQPFSQLSNRVSNRVSNVVWRGAGWFCYYAGRAITAALGRFLWRVKLEGAENIPTTGAFLLCPVHRSNVDGPLTCTFTRRHMRYLAKDNLFTGLTKRLFTEMGAIKVNRGAPDRQALARCLEALEAGQPLVLFPEGTRKSGPVIQEVNEGAAYLAFRAGVPIVPVGIGGSEAAMPKGAKFVKPAHIHVIVGEPIPFERPERRVARNSIDAATDVVRARMQELYDAARADTVPPSRGEQ